MVVTHMTFMHGEYPKLVCFWKIVIFEKLVRGHPSIFGVTPRRHWGDASHFLGWRLARGVTPTKSDSSREASPQKAIPRARRHPKKRFLARGVTLKSDSSREASPQKVIPRARRHPKKRFLARGVTPKSDSSREASPQKAIPRARLHPKKRFLARGVTPKSDSSRPGWIVWHSSRQMNDLSFQKVARQESDFLFSPM